MEKQEKCESVLALVVQRGEGADAADGRYTYAGFILDYTLSLSRWVLEALVWRS